MSWHRHIWGAKGRPPRTGDLCLTCCAVWTPRAGGYHVTDYKARTQPHHITRVGEEAA